MNDVERTGGEDVLDDEASAYHEAGHAVAMWKLGFGVEQVSIDPNGPMRAFTRQARDVEPTPSAPRYVHRAMVEQKALFLFAGDVTTRILRPAAGFAQSASDHRTLHALMGAVEDDGDVQNAWCRYLWQRAFTFMAWQGQWYLVVALARQLLLHRTLIGREAERFLTAAATRLQFDPWMPNCVLVGEVRNIGCPFHQDWIDRGRETPLPKRLLEVPMTLRGLSARADARSIRAALPDLSHRAERLLVRAGIRTAGDLEDWTPFALGALSGMGQCVLHEILDAVRTARIPLGPDLRKFPWEINPARWPQPRRMNRRSRRASQEKRR